VILPSSQTWSGGNLGVLDVRSAEALEGVKGLRGRIASEVRVAHVAVEMGSEILGKCLRGAPASLVSQKRMWALADLACEEDAYVSSQLEVETAGKTEIWDARGCG